MLLLGAWILGGRKGYSEHMNIIKGYVKVLKTYINKHEAYVMPKANIVFAGYKFHECVQGISEAFE